MILINIHVNLGWKRGLWKVKGFSWLIFFQKHRKQLNLKTFFKFRKLILFDTLELMRIGVKMVTVLFKQLFGIMVKVMIGFSKFSNGQTTKEAQVVLVAIRIILIFLQTNDIAIVLDIVGKWGGFPSGYVVITMWIPRFTIRSMTYFVFGLCSFKREGKSLAAEWFDRFWRSCWLRMRRGNFSYP